MANSTVFGRLCNWWQSPGREENDYYKRADGWRKKDVKRAEEFVSGQTADCSCGSCQLSCKKYLPIRNILPPQFGDVSTREQRVGAVRYLLSVGGEDESAHASGESSGDGELMCIRQARRQGGDKKTCVRQTAGKEVDEKRQSRLAHWSFNRTYRSC